MKALVIGSGGREHALTWALSQSSLVKSIVCAPGNPGMAQLARCVPVKADEIMKLADLADSEDVGLVVVGPEAPLVAGLADLLQSRGRAVFGCSRAAAELEGSKAFAKAFMAKHSIPTAAFGVFSDEAEADLFIDTQAERGAYRLVVKADGLAAGKGVTICDDPAQTKAEVRRMVKEGGLGDAGRRVVIEEFLVGREASLMAFVDGPRVTPLEPAEDHKTIFDGDKGPMTGGMGAVSPTRAISDLDVKRAVREALEPTARGMIADGRPYRGLLYAGLMLTVDGPKVLEYNCRFGDPETQAIVPRIADDLGALLHAVATGRMPERVRFHDRSACCVVMAAGGYPGPVAPATEIRGLDAAAKLKDVVVFHAGTRAEMGRVMTAGGRVLGVTGFGPSMDDARRRAYQAVDTIHFDGAQVRRDIGARP
jgi:phosphoribosylamine--glycine ligase